MVLQSSPPDGEELGRIYGADYYASWGGGADDHEGDAAVRPYWSLKKALAHALLDRLGPLPNGHALDVGCATGAFLEALAERGCTPWGVDVNSHAVRAAKARVPAATVRAGNLSDLLGDAPPFGAAILSDVIEHLHDPAAELATLHRLLAPGARIVVLTPDIGSLSARLMGRHWPHIKREHLCYFTRRSLSDCLARAGFTGIRVTASRKPLTLAYAVRQLTVYPQPVLSPAARMLGRLLPRPVLDTLIRLPMGEMLATAQKPG